MSNVVKFPADKQDANKEEQQSVQKPISFADAMEKLRHGAVLQCVDNGTGFNLSGLCFVAPFTKLTEMLKSTILSDDANIVGSQMLIINARIQDNGDTMLFYFRPVDFTANSVWLIVYDAVESKEPTKA